MKKKPLAIALAVLLFMGCGGLGIVYQGSQNFYRSVEKSDPVAQFTLGGIYYKGVGTPQNLETAAKWIQKAAEQGLAQAQFELGKMYYNGTGVTHNYLEAAKWLRLAASQDYPPAQFSLGAMYRDSKGVALDNIEADFWMKLAARSNNHNAITSIPTLEQSMTQQEIAEATRRVDEWKPTPNAATRDHDSHLR